MDISLLRNIRPRFTLEKSVKMFNGNLKSAIKFDVAQQ